MKRYIVQITIEEGYDEFWEGINNECKSGCDDIRDIIKNLLEDVGFLEAQVKVVEFTDKG